MTKFRTNLTKFWNYRNGFANSFEIIRRASKDSQHDHKKSRKRLTSLSSKKITTTSTCQPHHQNLPRHRKMIGRKIQKIFTTTCLHSQEPIRMGYDNWWSHLRNPIRTTKPQSLFQIRSHHTSRFKLFGRTDCGFNEEPNKMLIQIV